MGTLEGLVGTDGHDGQFKRPFASQGTKFVGQGRVAAEDDLFAFARNDVAVVTAIFVVTPARAPVPDLNGLDFGFGLSSRRSIDNSGLVSPAKFGRPLHPSATH